MQQPPVILVTGGAGFIGSHIVATLIARGHEVRVFDDFSSGHGDHNPRLAGAEIVAGDLRDVDAVVRAVDGVDVIYHQGAVPSVPRSVVDPRTSLDVGITGTLNVLLAARDRGVRRVVFASSSSVYGDTPESPKHESMMPRPLSPYAVSKQSAEQLCQVFHSLYGLETVVLRYFNVYGPGQDPDSPYAAVIPKFLRALSMGETPIIFGDGEQSRGFTFVDDVVHGNLLAGTVPEAAGEVMNLASDRSVTVNATLAMICAHLDQPVQAEYRPARPGDVRNSLADISKARSVLGFSPMVPFEEGLSRTVDAFVSTVHAGVH